MKTEEQARELLEMIGVSQVSAQTSALVCPRCGRMSMNPVARRNALSRYATVYICDSCGAIEALRDMSGQSPLPLNQWATIKAFDAEEAEE